MRRKFCNTLVPPVKAARPAPDLRGGACLGCRRGGGGEICNPAAELGHNESLFAKPHHTFASDTTLHLLQSASPRSD